MHRQAIRTHKKQPKTFGIMGGKVDAFLLFKLRFELLVPSFERVTDLRHLASDEQTVKEHSSRWQEE